MRCVCEAAMGRTSAAGPYAQATRQPVSPKSLPPEPTVIVRARIPSAWLGLGVGLGQGLGLGFGLGLGLGLGQVFRLAWAWARAWA